MKKQLKEGYVYFLDGSKIEYIYSDRGVAITRYKYVERPEIRFDVNVNKNTQIESLYRQDTEEEIMLENICKQDYRKQYNNKGDSNE